MSKTIRSWSDFEKYGINALTSESCGLGMRILCDVDRKGWNILDEFFGNTHSRNASSVVARILDDLDDMDLDRELVSEGRISDGGWSGTERVKRIRANLERLREMAYEHRTWLQSPRGQGVNDYRVPSSGSILLPHDLFQSLAVFCLLKEPGVVAVAVLPSLDTMQGGIYGWDQEDYDRWMSRPEHYTAVWTETQKRTVSPRIYTKSNHPGNGFRNTHAFAGFTET
jgi:hypothetical protein